MTAKMVYTVVALMIVFSLVPAIMLATPVMAQGAIYVDVNDGGCVVGSGQADPYAVVYCNIQDAIDDAMSGDTIIIAMGQYNEYDITINKSLVIRGAGSGSTYIDAGNSGGVFYVNASTVDMSGMTIRNGNTSTGGGIYKQSGNLTMTDCTVNDNWGAWGGGIYNFGGRTDTGTLTMTDCTINDNTATWGAGILNHATLTLTSCTISHNTATWGGGIINDAQVTMTDCTISDNTATYGGGIDSFGPMPSKSILTMSGCTVSGNTAEVNGGGISSGDGNVTMTNCTISGNEAGDSGGGICNSDGGNVTLTSCTVSDNEAVDDGGGIYNDDTVTLTCTIVYGNTAGDDGDDIDNDDTVNDPTGESIVGDADGYISGGPNPLLGSLRNNGGSTETHALLMFSPAIDGCTACPVLTDQRGILRPVDGDSDSIADCDIGAYEYIPPPPSAVPTLSQWGMIGMGIVLAGALIWSVRRRWIASIDES